jgi:hypothetical protein
MNRLTFLLVGSGLAVTLLAGCNDMKKRTSLRERRIAERTNAVAAVKRTPKPPVTPKSPPPAKASKPKPTILASPNITAGSAKHLDFKNGFRDVVFGQQESSISGLVLKSQDEQRQVKRFTRTGEELSLGGVPLESIEYSFFKGQLYQVLITWRIEQKEPAQKAPPAVTLVPFCSSLYGPPRHHVLNKKEGTELRWSGKRVELTLWESVIQGVKDPVKGGWAIAPLASGVMIMDNIDLRKSLGATLASATEARKDGL